MAVRLSPRTHWKAVPAGDAGEVQPTGRVVFILAAEEGKMRRCTPQRRGGAHPEAGRKFCGTLQKHGPSKGALFVSKDYRVPRIIIPRDACPDRFKTRPDEFKETLVSAAITGWRDE